MSTQSHISSAVRDVPLKRGYRSPAQLRETIAEAHRTRPLYTTAVALADNLSVCLILLAVTAPQVWEAAAAVQAIVILAGIVAAARQLRALECLVHEASHYNWSRNHRRLGDALATVLAAAPTGARIGEYRASHLIHHGRFGTADDPDLQRYRDLAIEDMNRSTPRLFTAALLGRFLAYQRGWLATLGSAPVASILPFAWCALMIATPAALLGGLEWALASSVVWMVTHLVALPLLRFVGESSEHIYREGDTVFAATVSNLGRLQRLVFHPHGDGYHTVHHMWPGVPHHQLARLHRALLRYDAAYREGLRFRTRVLQSPQIGWLEPRRQGQP